MARLHSLWASRNSQAKARRAAAAAAYLSATALRTGGSSRICALKARPAGLAQRARLRSASSRS